MKTYDAYLIGRAVERLNRTLDAWEESKHPRAKNGQFAKSSGGGGTGKTDPFMKEANGNGTMESGYYNKKHLNYLRKQLEYWKDEGRMAKYNVAKLREDLPDDKEHINKNSARLKKCKKEINAINKEIRECEKWMNGETQTEEKPQAPKVSGTTAKTPLMSDKNEKSIEQKLNSELEKTANDKGSWRKLRQVDPVKANEILSAAATMNEKAWEDYDFALIKAKRCVNYEKKPPAYQKGFDKIMPVAWKMSNKNIEKGPNYLHYYAYAVADILIDLERRTCKSKS